MWDNLPIWLQAILTLIIGFTVFMGIGWFLWWWFFGCKGLFIVLWGALAFVGGKPTGDTIIVIIFRK
jgi:hypothetical protein